jgi:hypothetical protein
MDARTDDRQMIERALSEYAAVPYAYGDVATETVFDRERDHYLLMIVGRDAGRRVHGCLVHIDVIGGDIWIQRDGTEHGMATDLVALGVPPERIVLAFDPTGAHRYGSDAAA